ncbi:hypothetical protein DF19_32960 [Streptomyces olindensis]|nr:hypothetical protein DF19_32960 [Streptomyces olindensis]
MHHTQWKTHTTRKAAGQWEDNAVPYTDIPACSVPACPLPSVQARGLCRHHAQRFREHRRTHPDAAVEPWAAQQHPYLAPHQFSLLPLPEPLRWEVLYGLQQVDPWLRIFEPPQVRRMVRDLAGTGRTLVSDISDPHGVGVDAVADWQSGAHPASIPANRASGATSRRPRSASRSFPGTRRRIDHPADLRRRSRRWSS